MDRLQQSVTAPALRPAARVAVIAFCAEAAHTMLFIPLLQSYLPSHLHWTPAFPGYALTAFATSKLITQAPAGKAVDRIGTRLSAVIGTSLLLLSGILFALVRVPLLFLGVAALYGAGSAFLWPALFAYVAARFGEEQHGRMAATVQFAEASGVGVGVAAGALLVDHAGYGAGFAGYLCLIAVALLAILSAGRSTTSGTPLETKRQAISPAALRELLTTAVTLELTLLVLTGTCLTLAPNLLMPIVRDYAVHELHVQLDQLIIPLAVVGAIGAAALVASGAASDRLGRPPVTLLGLGVAIAGFWLLGGADSVTAAMIAAIPAAAGYLITQPAWSAAVLDAAQSGYRGTQFSLVMLAQGLAEALAPALGGKVAESFGPAAVFRLAAIVLALAVVFTTSQMLCVRQRRPRRAA